MIAEIKFACSHCGQRIAVGSDAAGLSVDCPTCQNAVMIPDGAVPLEPRRKDGGLGEKLAAAQSECERLRANATHAQAEIKSFHNERLTLRSEAASLKQRAATAESRIAAMQDELSESRAALERTRAAAAIAEARAIEVETERAAIAGRHETALGEMASLRGLLDKDAASRELLATKSNLAAAGEELRTRRQSAAQLEADLRTSETERKRLDEERSAMQRRVTEALKLAEDSSKDRIHADNEKLRELLERQNEELKIRFRELTRFRRAKLTLKIIWALAALGLVGLGFLFVHILPTIEWSR